jgi:hypothetical protein
MNTDFALLLFWFGISATVNVALGIALWRTARRVKRLESRDQLPGPRDEQTERLEQLIETLGTQVDQLSSGQDFLNRVVADRLDKIARGLPAPDGGAAPGTR